MPKRKLTLQEHLNHPNYGFRFGLVLKHLEEQYSWDIEEITSQEDVILVITLSLEQNIPPAKIAEQIDAQLKAKEEEEIEPISAPETGVGMFESDLWEHEIPRAAMHGPWALPPAKGGFLHTPRIESPRSSPHYVPGWQKVRIYAQDLLDKGISKTRQEIADDLGINLKTVTIAIRGTIGLLKGSFAQAHPDLPRIEVAEKSFVPKVRASKALIYGWGDQDESDDYTLKLKEEITNAFVERITQDDESDQWNTIEELAKEYKIGTWIVVRLLGDLYDKDLSEEQRVMKSAKSKLEQSGTDYAEIEEYLRAFGEDLTDRQIGIALGAAGETVSKTRKKLKIKFPEFDISGRRLVKRYHRHTFEEE